MIDNDDVSTVGAIWRCDMYIGTCIVTSRLNKYRVSSAEMRAEDWRRFVTITMY